jgi:probable rRNA maturation factor
MNILNCYTEGKVKFPYNNISIEEVKSLVNNICTYLKIENVSISFIFTDNDSIRLVNHDYRDKDYATDVISFAYRENPFPQNEEDVESLGDIFISLEKADEQAIEYKTTFFDEIKHLLIHGILHLIGYDHETSAEDEKVMQQKEDEIYINV